MDIRRGMAMGLVGLALVVGSTGCSKIGEKVAEEAIEQNSNCEGVDVDVEEGGFSGTCDGQDIDANVSGNADLPEGYPAEVAPPEGFAIISATGTAGESYDVFGSIDGEVDAVYESVKTQLTDAGYTVDAATDTLAEGPTGTVGNFTATGPEFAVNVTVSEVTQASLDGNITVNYVLTKV